MFVKLKTSYCFVYLFKKGEARYFKKIYFSFRINSDRKFSRTIAKEISERNSLEPGTRILICFQNNSFSVWRIQEDGTIKKDKRSINRILKKKQKLFFPTSVGEFYQKKKECRIN